MFDITDFVNNYYPKIRETGLFVEDDVETAIQRMEAFPADMLEDLHEEGRLMFLFVSLHIADAFDVDMEGLEYKDFLRKVQDISSGELVFEDAQQVVSKETYEKGTGIEEVSFKCNGREYSFIAEFNYDWFDGRFIHYLNTVLEKQGLEKRLIVFGEPNGYLFTYKKPEFIETFKSIFPTLEVELA